MSRKTDKASFKLTIDQTQIDRLGDDMSVKRLLERLAIQIVPVAQQLAPKKTGSGAASIHATLRRNPDYEALIGWAPDFYYLLFHDRGTKRRSEPGKKGGVNGVIKAKRFLKKAARRQYKNVKSWEV